MNFNWVWVKSLIHIHAANGEIIINSREAIEFELYCCSVFFCKMYVITHFFDNLSSFENDSNF